MIIKSSKKTTVDTIVNRTSNLDPAGSRSRSLKYLY